MDVDHASSYAAEPPPPPPYPDGYLELLPSKGLLQICDQESGIEEANKKSHRSYLNLSKTFFTESVVWQYEDDKGDWHSMSTVDSRRHEEHFRAGIKTFNWEYFYGKKRDNSYHYHSNLEILNQHNQTTDTTRDIRRLVVCNPSSIPHVIP